MFRFVDVYGFRFLFVWIVNHMSQIWYLYGRSWLFVVLSYLGFVCWWMVLCFFQISRVDWLKARSGFFPSHWISAIILLIVSTVFLPLFFMISDISFEGYVQILSTLYVFDYVLSSWAITFISDRDRYLSNNKMRYLQEGLSLPGSVFLHEACIHLIHCFYYCWETYFFAHN